MRISETSTIVDLERELGMLGATLTISPGPEVTLAVADYHGVGVAAPSLHEAIDVAIADLREQLKRRMRSSPAIDLDKLVEPGGPVEVFGESEVSP